MKNLALILTFVIAPIWAMSQSKPSIAVAYPSVQGLSTNSELASKMMRLELIKLNLYSVYDEFDMAEIIKDKDEYKNGCYGMSCLIKMGEELGVDYIISGSYDGLSNRIAVSFKLIDVKGAKLHKSMVREFDDQEDEVQRMTEVLLMEMHDIIPPKELVDRIKYNNELITSNNVGKINNSGPRVGYGMMIGSMYEFASRSQQYGGLEIFPGVSMIGYQLEAQYVGTENFSALVEGLINITGLEQGVFLPSLSILNGFRFGRAGWEFAFGPGFGVKKMSKGFFDNDGAFLRGKGAYYSESDWASYANDNYNDINAYPAYFDEWGSFHAPTPAEASGNDSYTYADHFDTRGASKFSTTWVMAFGRTFRAGSLNIPVNIFYSAGRGGGLAGMSIGFNVQNRKKKIND